MTIQQDDSGSPQFLSLMQDSNSFRVVTQVDELNTHVQADNEKKPKVLLGFMPLSRLMATALENQRGN
jgi:hypothetical protein